MGESDYFLSLRPASPWSSYPFGLPALGLVALALIVLTLVTYRRNPAATRGRLAVILGLRLLALLLALVTTLRPSLGIQEDPKVPSTLLIGIDLSESMTIRDEFNNQTRIEAVRKVLEKCEPTIAAIREEQGVSVVFYSFGNPDFAESTGAYTPESPATFKRSDYGIYLQRTFDKWQTERFLRAHLLIGDGADNGTSAGGEAEAARWRAVAPIQTFSVGSNTTRPDGKDIAVAAASFDPSPVPIKNDVTLKVIVNAYGFTNAKVPVIVSFDGKQVAKETASMPKETGNEVLITLKAPDTPGEIKVRIEIPVVDCPGDANPSNNVLETFLTVTKEGVRLLIIDRDRFEHTLIRDVLRAEKRFDITDVVRQRDDPPSPDERTAFDFDNRHYDAIVIGNISAKQLQAIDPRLPEKIREQILTKGTGLVMLGGDATFAGTMEHQFDTGWKGTALEELLPVSLTPPTGVNDDVFRSDTRRFQTVPTDKGLDYLLKVGPDADRSFEQWRKLNEAMPYCRMTAIARLGEPKPGAVVYALAAEGRQVDGKRLRPDQVKAPYLLVGWETNGEGKGRVLAFAGYDTYLWKPWGRRNEPPTRDGIEIHAQFWRRIMLWLAKQDQAEGAAYAKPEFRRLPVRGPQSILIGLRNPDGAEVTDAQLDVKIVLPGQSPEQAASRTPIVDGKGQRRVIFEPPTAGNYTVILKAKGRDAAGNDVQGDATARFVAYPEASDELLRAAADPDYLERIARTSGGQPHTLADLPQFLSELKGQPLMTTKKPRFIPDWRRNHSGGFLPGWVVAFAIVLGFEWGLRRIWGMA